MSQFERTFCALVLGAFSLVCTVQSVQAQEQQRPQRPDEARNGDAAKPEPPTPPIPPEKSSVTHHDLTLDGKDLHYTATAGTLLIRDGEDDHPYGSIFYVAYTLDGAEANSRPVTFLYNGGPGSATIWLHMGSFGPMRVVTDSPAATGPAPYQLVPNQSSLLDKTDLV
ncbi:MAG: peptidase S10, partial [Acidobacteriaceae bacterium]